MSGPAERFELEPRESFEHIVSDAEVVGYRLRALNSAKRLLRDEFFWQVFMPGFVDLEAEPQNAELFLELQCELLPELVGRVNVSFADLQDRYESLKDAEQQITWDMAVAFANEDEVPVFINGGVGDQFPGGSLQGAFDGFKLLYIPESDTQMLVVQMNRGGEVYWAEPTPENLPG